MKCNRPAVPIAGKHAAEISICCASTPNLDMRGKIHLLRHAWARFSNEVHQDNEALTNEKYESLYRIQELEVSVIHTASRNTELPADPELVVVDTKGETD